MNEDGRSRIVTIPGFRSAALGNERAIHVCLPPGYDAAGSRRYPVLYVHDGQNVFAPAFNGQCWNLHRTCDRLIAEGRIEPLLIVAVENAGADRSAEFAHAGPHAGRLDYECRGESYERFLIEEVKPTIDRLFLTKPGPDDTGLMGSSRGGLVTYHIGFRRPDVFGKLAMLSPYFAQYDERTMSHEPIALPFAVKQPLRIWIDVGGMEGMTVRVEHVREMAERLVALGYRPGDDLAYYCDPDAAHDERAWETRVHAPLVYLFGEPGASVAAVALHGRQVAGREGCAAYLNPVCQYESGFMMTDLDAAYEVEPATAAAVDRSGRVRPGSGDVRACTIRYSRGGCSAALAMSFVPALSREVRVSLSVHVPPDTPDDARLYAGVELHRTGPATFGRQVTLPRDTGFAFRIGLHAGWLEADEDGRDVERRYVADRDLALSYEVRQWKRGHSL